jgi:hypothetical protein
MYSQQYPERAVVPHYVAVMRGPDFENLYGPWFRILVSGGQLQQMADILLVAREGQTKTQQNTPALQQGISVAMQCLE